MLLHFNGESPCLSKSLEINTAAGRNLSLCLCKCGELKPQANELPIQGTQVHDGVVLCPLYCPQMLLLGSWSCRQMTQDRNGHTAGETQSSCSAVLCCAVLCCVEAGYCNSDWQRSVRAAQVTQPRLQSWGCFGAFWYAAHFTVFKSDRQVSPLRMFCRVFGIYVNILSCSKVLHTSAVHHVKKCLPFFWTSYYLHLTICIGRNTEQLFPIHCLLSPMISQVYSIICCVLQPEGLYAIFITFSYIN